MNSDIKLQDSAVEIIGDTLKAGITSALEITCDKLKMDGNTEVQIGAHIVNLLASVGKGDGSFYVSTLEITGSRLHAGTGVAYHDGIKETANIDIQDGVLKFTGEKLQANVTALEIPVGSKLLLLQPDIKSKMPERCMHGNLGMTGHSHSIDINNKPAGLGDILPNLGEYKEIMLPQPPIDVFETIANMLSTINKLQDKVDQLETKLIAVTPH